jgi:hypothetical protein
MMSWQYTHGKYISTSFDLLLKLMPGYARSTRADDIHNPLNIMRKFIATPQTDSHPICRYKSSSTSPYTR